MHVCLHVCLHLYLNRFRSDIETSVGYEQFILKNSKNKYRHHLLEIFTQPIWDVHFFIVIFDRSGQYIFTFFFNGNFVRSNTCLNVVSKSLQIDTQIEMQIHVQYFSIFNDFDTRAVLVFV